MFTRFYHGSFKRYVATFGTMFNNMSIQRPDGSTYKVPLAYMPRERALARLREDPNLDKPVAHQLPRMSFEMTGLGYAPERKQRTTNQFSTQSTIASSFDAVYVPVPYDIQLRLSIFAKQSDDAMQIVEQILPYFTPDWTFTIQIVDVPVVKIDVPIVLQSVSFTDTYEGTFDQDARVIEWTLDFTMQAQFFGPNKTKQLIKFVKTRLMSSIDANVAVDTFEQTTVQPGLTANGQPTTDINETIPYANIEPDDDWDFIVQTSVIND